MKTLSGGETFMASLSLALGMADVIARSSGGIQLETMFIDEGFGSLDSDSLDLALRILSDLSGGQQLVGIISHVSELAARQSSAAWLGADCGGVKKGSGFPAGGCFPRRDGGIIRENGEICLQGGF